MLHFTYRFFTNFLRIYRTNIFSVFFRRSAIRTLQPIKHSDYRVPAVIVAVCWSVRNARTEKQDSDIVDEDLERIIQVADNLFDRNEFVQLLQHLTEYEEHNEPRLLWRLGRACYKVAVAKETSKERAKELSYRALELAKKSLSMDANSFSAHKWAGITLSHIGSYEGLTEKIKQAYTVKQHFEAALKLNPKDATSWHLLGQWCFTIAEITWIERKVLSTVLTQPPTSSFQEAMACFERAEQEEAGFYSMNYLYLAKTSIKLNRKSEAMQWLDKLLAYTVTNDEDATAVETGRDMRNRL